MAKILIYVCRLTSVFAKLARTEGTRINYPTFFERVLGYKFILFI